MLCMLVPVLSGFLCGRAMAAETTRYSWLVHRMADAPSDRIMKAAGGYSAKGRHGEAAVLYSIVRSRFSEDMDDAGKNLCALACLKAGNIYYDRGNYAGALEEFVSGVKISGTCRRPACTARLYNNIGNIHCVFLDYEKGISYYLKAYARCRESSAGRKTEHDILINLAGTYMFVGKTALARKYYRLSEQRKNPGDPVDAFLSGYMLSIIQAEEGRLRPAVARLRRLATGEGLAPKFRCFAYQELYTAYEKMGRPDSALVYMQMCDSVARRHSLSHTFCSTLKKLSGFYERAGDRGKADLYRVRYQDIMDSVYDLRSFDAVKNSLFNYEVNKTAREIQELRTREQLRMQTIRTQRAVMAAVVAVAVIAVLFLFVVWRQKRRLDRSYADLYTVNRDFIVSQEQLTARLREARGQTGAETAVPGGCGGQPEADAQPEAVKYKTSSLTEEQRLHLVDAIRNVMENTTDFCDCGFSLDTLAEKVGSNRKYVSQVINDTFNKTFTNYVNPYRIHLACSRIDDTAHYGNMTMKAIAESVGFRSYTSFVNIFRKVTGITPQMYKKMSERESVC